ncbi:MAG: flagellar biosynthesis protein FlhB [Phycisphaerales bacterium]|nr:MAG: flagellar biosynthesis protein FlhB [Phycisphaerales bacterium]
MPDNPAAERTEQPTPRRLAKAREKGQTPQSQELLSFVSILVLVATVSFLAPDLMRWFVAQMKQGMSLDTSVFRDNKAFMSFMNSKIMDLTLVVCPFFAALSVGAILGSIAFSGPNFAPGAVRLDLNSINPVVGMGRLVNARSFVRLLVSILKLLFVSLIAWYYLQDKLDMLTTLRWAWSLQILLVIGKMILGLMIRVCLALLVIGAADATYQKWKYRKELRMTKQEVKEDRRQTEGAPEVKSRIRKIQYQAALKRMLQEVPKASVVLVNPTHVAVALRYDAKSMDAPVLVAKGADHLAEKIREVARAYGVPVVRRPELARTIYSTVRLDEPIPDALYVAVAEVLAMIYRLRRRRYRQG